MYLEISLVTSAIFFFPVELSVFRQVLTGCFVLTRGKEWMYTNDSRLLAAGPSWMIVDRYGVDSETGDTFGIYLWISTQLEGITGRYNWTVYDGMVSWDGIIGMV